MKAETECPGYDAKDFKNVPFVDVSAVLSDDGKQLSVFAVNRSLTEGADIDFNIDGFDAFKLKKHIALENDDLNAANTKDIEQVSPIEKPLDNTAVAPHSWNLFVFEVA